MEALALRVDAHLNGKVERVVSLGDELASEVEAAELLTVCGTLHYGRDEWQTETATRSGFSRGRVARTSAPDPEMPGRFAVAYQLLSITHNRRLRLRVKCADTNEPVVDSVVDIWSSANWFERE